MEAYKTPASDLTTNEKPAFKPVKAVLLSLSIGIILLSIISLILVVVFGFIVGVDFESEAALETLISTSWAYLASDLIISTLIIYYAGVILGQNTPGHETKFTIIVSILLLAAYLALDISIESKISYPFWYDYGTYITIPVALYFGAKSTIKHNR